MCIVSRLLPLTLVSVFTQSQSHRSPIVGGKVFVVPCPRIPTAFGVLPQLLALWVSPQIDAQACIMALRRRHRVEENIREIHGIVEFVHDRNGEG